MKFKGLVVGICVISLIVSGTFSANAGLAQVISSPAVATLANQLNSPEAVARYIFRHFQYETDQRQFGQSEHWQSPEELLANRRGDCDDFALFASEVLKANGMTAFMVNIYGQKFAHTVCVFKENGKYQILDGDQVKRFETDNLMDIFSKIYPYWNKAQLVAYAPSHGCGRVLKTFTRA